MKKIISTIMLLAAAAMAFVSCQKDIEPSQESELVTLTFTSANPATKTEWNGSTIIWSKGDKIRVACTADDMWQDGNGDVEEGDDTKFYESAGLSDVTEKASFIVPTDFTESNLSGKSCKFYAVYPNSAVNLNFKAPESAVTIPTIQTSSAETFDKQADVLYGVSDAYSGRPTTSVDLLWNRLVAHVEFSLNDIQGIVEGETIERVTFTAQEDAALTGKYTLNVGTGEYVAKETSNIITINCSDVVADASGNAKVWACINPCTVTSLNISIETNLALYTVEKTGFERTFLQNRRNQLPVNMSAATRTTGEALPFEEDFSALTAGNNTTDGTAAAVTELVGFISVSGSAYQAGGAIRLANGNNPGSLTTKLLDLSSPFYVMVKAKGWDYDELTFTVSAGETSKEVTMTTTREYDFMEYVLEFDAVGKSESVIFSTKSGKRVFIDHIYIGAGAPSAGPVISAQTPASVDAAGGTVTISYQVTDPEEGVSLTASTDADWLTDVQYADGTVSYTVAANTGAERTAAVTLSYEGAESVSVTITQAAATSEDTKYYVKVTEAPADWSGTYLLAAGGSDYFVVLNGMNEYGKTSYGTYTTDVVAENGKIKSDDTTDCYQIVINKTVNGYSMQFGEYYLGKTTKSNDIRNQESYVSGEYDWVLTCEEEVVKIKNYTRDTYYLMWANASNAKKFACYTSSQTDVQLYKLQD